jgi:hypothetical protein
MIINENIFIDVNKKLKDAIHDIITDIKPGYVIELNILSDRLRDKYSIFITPSLLERYMVLFKKDKSESIFTNKDKRWLKWDSVNKKIGNNLTSNKIPKLGKSRRKIYMDEIVGNYDILKTKGWTKTSSKDFKFLGPSISHNDINIKNIKPSIYEKQKYSKNEFPFTIDVLLRIFPDKSSTFIKLYNNLLLNAYKTGDIKYNINGNRFYFNCFKYLVNILEKRKIEIDFDNKNIVKYLPTIAQKIIIRNNKLKDFKNTIKDLSEDETNVILDREEAVNMLKNMINVNKKYYIVLTKYTKSQYFLKKIMNGYFSISKELMDNRYNILFKLHKNDDDSKYIIYFKNFDLFKYFIEYSIFDKDNNYYTLLNKLDEVKVFYHELKKYKKWDEYLDNQIIDKLKFNF